MRPLRFLAWVVGAILLVVSVTPVVAIDSPPPRPPAGALGLIRDLRLTVLARRALQGDPALAPLNLGVRVRNGVAELWGPVPAAETARDAVTRVESIKGILEVRPGFFLQPDRQDTLPLSYQAAAPMRFEAAKPDGTTGSLPMLPRPQVVAGSSEAPRKAMTTGSASRPVGPQTQRSAVLLAPRSLSPRAGESRAADVRPQPLTSLAAAVQRIQRSDPRFQNVPVQVQGSKVVLRRGLTPDEDVIDLATELRHLPGVTEVRMLDQ